MKSKVFKLAHKVKANFSSFSEALIFAWAKVKLTTKLRQGICSFQFKKKTTGTLRDCLGTLSDSEINYTPKGGKSCSKWNILKFWDTEKDAWRMLDVRSVTIINNKKQNALLTQAA